MCVRRSTVGHYQPVTKTVSFNPFRNYLKLLLEYYITPNFVSLVFELQARDLLLSERFKDRLMHTFTQNHDYNSQTCSSFYFLEAFDSLSIFKCFNKDVLQRFTYFGSIIENLP